MATAPFYYEEGEGNFFALRLFVNRIMANLQGSLKPRMDLPWQSSTHAGIEAKCQGCICTVSHRGCRDFCSFCGIKLASAIRSGILICH